MILEALWYIYLMQYEASGLNVTPFRTVIYFFLTFGIYSFSYGKITKRICQIKDVDSKYFSVLSLLEIISESKRLKERLGFYR